MADQAATLRSMMGATSKYSKVITFSSGKGGVGKSNIICNLAIMLAGRGLRVAILDMDLGLANLDILLGVSSTYNLTHVMAKQKKITEIIVPGPNNIMFIPGASGVSRLANMNENERNFLIKNFSELESLTDIILVDTGAGLSDNVLHFALASHALIVVTTPEPTARMDAYALIKTAHNKDKSLPFHIIVNEVASDNEGENVYNSLLDVCQKHLSLELNFLGFVPTDPKIPQAVKRRRPFSIEFPNCNGSKSLEKITSKFQNEFLPNHGKGKDRMQNSFFSRLFSIFK
jgi:flagellar biosynthesis protein FlhG